MGSISGRIEAKGSGFSWGNLVAHESLFLILLLLETRVLGYLIYQ